MEEALKDMPRGLNDAFEETLQRIHKLPEGRRRLGLNTLMWISHVRKPLTVGELSDALATRLGEASLNTKYRPSQKRMVDCCLGLVTVDEETSIIRLVHYTAQEYLQEHLDQTFDLAGQTIAELIAELALTYLMTEPFAQGCCPDKVSIWSILARYPFIKYASQFWGNHVLNANSERINKIAFNYLQARPQLEMSFQICRYTLGYREVYWELKEARSTNGLHLAAYFGLDDVAKQILDANALDVDSATSMGTTALILASASGHIPILKTLLKKGANTRKENWYGTALHCSAESGKVSSIIELLETGIDVNVRSHGRTALVCAVSQRHIEAMLELVKRGGKE